MAIDKVQYRPIAEGFTIAGMEEVMVWPRQDWKRYVASEPEKINLPTQSYIGREKLIRPESKEFVNHRFVSTIGKGDFSETHFKFCVFNGVNFKDLNMKGFILEDCSLVKCAFDGANIDGSKVIRTRFMKCTFKGMKDENIWEGASVIGGSLEGADLSGANIDGVELKDVDVTGLSLKNAKVEGCKFEGCKGMDTVDFEGAELKDVEIPDKEEKDKEGGGDGESSDDDEKSSKKKRSGKSRYLTAKERQTETMDGRGDYETPGAVYNHPYASKTKSTSMNFKSLKTKPSGQKAKTTTAREAPPGRGSGRGGKYRGTKLTRAGRAGRRGTSLATKSVKSAAAKQKSGKDKVSTFSHSDTKHLSATRGGHFVDRRRAGRGSSRRGTATAKSTSNGARYDHLLCDESVTEKKKPVNPFGLSDDMEATLAALGI